MLGKNKPVDDWFSDLWENAKIIQHLALLEYVKDWGTNISWATYLLKVFGY